MFEVRVEAEFSASHFLTHYHGKCERLHGHNYQVFAHARGETLNEGNMLLDFTVFKKALRQVCEQLDHRHLNEIPFFGEDPSAEKIAVYIFNGIKEILPDCPLVAVDVFETPTSRARYSV
ncbi:MAG: 6-carboxytetrahydropterin synthase QueD [Spirochaetaceae bacterium]|nr:6-carboxytetrahydropterin synthase QueD [Spirochaetaceae bacterium]